MYIHSLKQNCAHLYHSEPTLQSAPAPIFASLVMLLLKFFKKNRHRFSFKCLLSFPVAALLFAIPILSASVCQILACAWNLGSRVTPHSVKHGNLYPSRDGRSVDSFHDHTSDHCRVAALGRTNSQRPLYC